MQSENGTSPAGRRWFLGRRGVLTAAAAFAGAAIARLGGAPRAEATHSPGTGGPANSDGQAMHVDTVNNGSQRTFLVGSAPGTPPLIAFNGAGPFSIGQADGIQGITLSNVGFAAGVQGRNHAASGPSVGVYGTTLSTSGTGVLGRSGVGPGSIPPTANGVGVWGTGGTAGVRGVSTNGGTGLRGDASGGSGGTAVDGRGGLYGVIGVASQANGTGFLGYCPGGIGTRSDTETGVGLMAVAGQSSGYAARLFGRVVVEGPFEVIGGPKNALVPHPDGSHRRMYCQEATEPWFEDFGEARLVNGRATVRLDADFDAVVRGDSYSVFLTPEGDSKGLYVADKRPHVFEVREQQGGTSSLSFSYRVVAKRKDIEGRRMEKVGRPERPERLPDNLRRGPDIQQEPGRDTNRGPGQRAPEIPA